MNTNELILSFLSGNYLLIGLIFLLLIRIIPQEWAGFWKYNNNKESDGRTPRISLLRLFLHLSFESILSAFLIPLIASFGLKNMVSLIIFIMVFFDVFIRHQISSGAVTLISIGILALYLDKLIDTGERIKLFGLLTWEKIGFNNKEELINDKRKTSNKKTKTK